MFRNLLYIPIIATAAALAACAQSPTATNPLGSATVSQPAHRAKPALTSTSVTIRNMDTSAIAKVGLSAHCLTGSPPASVPGSSSSAPFSVSYTGTCSTDTGSFDMTYDPDASAADACTFNISYIVSTGMFSYSVTNNDTNCSYVPGATPGSVTFIYAKS